MVTTLGAAAIPVIVVITITGYLLCLLLAELSAMMPERTGGSPSYAYPAYRERWPRAGEAHQRLHRVGVLARLVPGRAAEHDPGVVLPRRPLRPEHDDAASRRSTRSSPGGRSASRSSGSCSSSSRPTSASGFGAAFATVLGLLSMIPLTFLAIACRSSSRPSRDWGQLLGLHAARRNGLLHRPQRPRLVHDLHRLRVPADLERDRDGGGRLLHRRVQEPGARREDRDEPRGRVRPLHLHA